MNKAYITDWSQWFLDLYCDMSNGDVLPEHLCWILEHFYGLSESSVDTIADTAREYLDNLDGDYIK